MIFLLAEMNTRICMNFFEARAFTWLALKRLVRTSELVCKRARLVLTDLLQVAQAPKLALGDDDPYIKLTPDTFTISLLLTLYNYY
jgi:hypothetical protein